MKNKDALMYKKKMLMKRVGKKMKESCARMPKKKMNKSVMKSEEILKLWCSSNLVVLMVYE